MRKLGLSDWASIAEIAGTIAVVISLLVVAYSLDRNTTALSGQILLVNPALESMIERAQADVSNLTISEYLQYKRYLGLHLDIWERAITRENEGLIDEQSVAGWHTFYQEFFRRYLTKEMWEEMEWQWTDSELHQRVDAALISD